MKSVVRKSWRNSAALIVLSRSGDYSRGNYEVLLQTRSQGSSFRSAVVFPGGVEEVADGSPAWLDLLRSFGYTQDDFNAFHRPQNSVTPLFQNNPVQRHITLRITAIRETFEELGLLFCTKQKRGQQKDLFASRISDLDVKHWQDKVSKDPEEFLTLCSELNCCPDIGSLYYWSEWLTPANLPNRFYTAFFVIAVSSKPTGIKETSEVAKVEWSTPSGILDRINDPSVLLWPPQSYELTRLAHWKEIESVTKFASTCGTSLLYYHVTVQGTDGMLYVFPGDDLYPAIVDYNNLTVITVNKTVQELRESSNTAHRIEFKEKPYLVLKNFKPNNMDLGDKISQLHLTHNS